MAKVYELAKQLPVGLRVAAGGQASAARGDHWRPVVRDARVGILVAYMVLASQFNSFLHPVTVLTILPLAVCGAILGLVVSGKTLNLFSMIGLLLLMGIVKKNSILLVEYAEQVREHEHLGALEARCEGRPASAAPDPHDHGRDDDGCRSADPRPRTRHRDPQPDGRGGPRRSHRSRRSWSLLVVPAFYVVTDRMKARIFGRKAPPARAGRARCFRPRARKPRSSALSSSQARPLSRAGCRCHQAARCSSGLRHLRSWLHPPMASVVANRSTRLRRSLCSSALLWLALGALLPFRPLRRVQFSAGYVVVRSVVDGSSLVDAGALVDALPDGSGFSCTEGVPGRLLERFAGEPFTCRSRVLLIRG